MTLSGSSAGGPAAGSAAPRPAAGSSAGGPALLLVAHGTREAAGAEVARRLAGSVRRRLPGVPVRLAFVDVRPPTVAHVLPTLLRTPERFEMPEVVVVPAFLASGYHVRHDLPAQLAAAGVAGRVRVTPALGPDPRLVAAAEHRLRARGWRPGDATVLAAAGSSDPTARAEVAAAARALGRRLGCPVRVGYLASGTPKVDELVAELRAGPGGAHRRVAVASWLLAPGVFQHRLYAAGADVAAAPLGVQRGVLDALLARYRDTLAARPAVA